MRWWCCLEGSEMRQQVLLLFRFGGPKDAICNLEEEGLATSLCAVSRWPSMRFWGESRLQRWNHEAIIRYFRKFVLDAALNAGKSFFLRIKSREWCQRLRVLFLFLILWRLRSGMDGLLGRKVLNWDALSVVDPIPPWDGKKLSLCFLWKLCAMEFVHSLHWGLRNLYESLSLFGFYTKYDFIFTFWNIHNLKLVRCNLKLNRLAISVFEALE